MPLRKRPRKQNRIRLRKICKWIGNLRLRFVELVLPQLLVARRVHAQDQKVALVLKSRVRNHFNHRLGQLHPRRRPHRVERLFRKSRLARRHFKCRFAGQPLNRQCQ